MSNTKFKTQADLTAAIKKFKEENNREPTAQDFDADPSLPSARQVQRRFGGLAAVREAAGMEVKNFTTGTTRAKVAKQSLDQSKKYEKELYERLHKKYHDTSGTTTYVTREWAWQQWLPEGQYYSNTRCDVCIDDRRTGHHIIVDFFYAKDMDSVYGSVRIKNKKYEHNPVSLLDGATHEVLFVCINPAITQDQLSPVGSAATLLSYEKFVEKFL